MCIKIYQYSLRMYNFIFLVTINNVLLCIQLSDQFENDETFEFIENNSWPVRKSQESSLSVWDLVTNNCITIVKKKIKRNIKYEAEMAEKRLK